MTDAEKQLRDILREHAADTEHLLDALKADWEAGEFFSSAVPAAQKIIDLELSLAALCRAVAPFLAVARVYALWDPPLSQRQGAGYFVFRVERHPHEAGLAVNDFERLLAAHDAATVPKPDIRTDHATRDTGDCPDWCPACKANMARGLNPDGTLEAPVPPTLTMEEVKEALEELIEDEGSLPFADGSWWTWVEGALNRVLAQKGADRGG